MGVGAGLNDVGSAGLVFEARPSVARRRSARSWQALRFPGPGLHGGQKPELCPTTENRRGAGEGRGPRVSGDGPYFVIS